MAVTPSDSSGITTNGKDNTAVSGHCAAFAADTRHLYVPHREYDPRSATVSGTTYPPLARLLAAMVFCATGCSTPCWYSATVTFATPDSKSRKGKKKTDRLLLAAVHVTRQMQRQRMHVHMQTLTMADVNGTGAMQVQKQRIQMHMQRMQVQKQRIQMHMQRMQVQMQIIRALTGRC